MSNISPFLFIKTACVSNLHNYPFSSHYMHLPYLHSIILRSVWRWLDLNKVTNDIFNIKFNKHFLVFTSLELTVALESISLTYPTLNSLGSPHPALIFSVACEVYPQIAT